MLMDSGCNTDHCNPKFTGAPTAPAVSAAPAAAGALQRQMLPQRSNTRSVSLLQKEAFPSRGQDDSEEEPENQPSSRKHKEQEVTEKKTTVDETREEKGSLQAKRPSVGGMSALKLNHFASSHGDDKTSRGLQPVFPLQLSSRGIASDANSTTAFVVFPTNGSWLSQWIGLQQLTALLHSKVMSELGSVTSASLRTDNAAFWLLSAAAVVIVVVLIFLWHRVTATLLSGSASTDSDTLRDRAMTTHRGPASARALPTSPQNPALLTERGLVISGAEKFLCPFLVVPPTHEATFRVPLNVQSSFHVTTVEGSQVLKVELKVDRHEKRRRVQLMSNDGSVILAQCTASPVQGNVTEFHLERGSGEHFAKFSQAWPDELTNRSSHETKWILRTGTGEEWVFRGQFDSYSVEVADTSDRLLAVACPDVEVQHNDAGKSCSVRVAPRVDVSIVLLGLLAVNHLM